MITGGFGQLYSSLSAASVDAAPPLPVQAQPDSARLDRPWQQCQAAMPHSSTPPHNARQERRGVTSPPTTLTKAVHSSTMGGSLSVHLCSDTFLRHNKQIPLVAPESICASPTGYQLTGLPPYGYSH